MAASTANSSTVNNRRRKLPTGHLTLREKTVIHNVHQSIVMEFPDIGATEQKKKTAKYTGFAVSTIYTVLTEVQSTGHVSPPKKIKHEERIILDDHAKYLIRRTVHQFFFKQISPTIDAVHEEIKKDPDIPKMGRSKLYKVLKKLQFRFKKRGRKTFLIDRPEITVWRAKFLREIEKFRSEGKKIFYLDETWINEGHTKTKIWVDESVKSARQAFIEGLSTGLKDPCGKGKRLIILHIGSEDGFLDGGLLLFEGSKSGDYHQEMNATVFETWFAKMLKALPDNAVIVLDNASYHSRKVEKIPTTSWRKGDIQNWLASKNISFDLAMVKAELLFLVKQHKHKFESYVVDELAAEDGKTVLRLPPYHCDLNPIELIWAQIKNEVASKNKTFKLSDVKPLFQQAVEHVTDENWKKCIEHVKKIENEMKKIGETFGTVPELIISLQESSSESSSDFLTDSDKENYE